MGDNVEMRITAIDDTNARVRTGEIIRTIRDNDGRALVGLVGGQSNTCRRYHTPAARHQHPGGPRRVST